jgi:hypothetical protein
LTVSLTWDLILRLCRRPWLLQPSLRLTLIIQGECPEDDEAGQAGPAEDHADEAGLAQADAVGLAVPVAAQRRSGRANRGVLGHRLGFEHEAFFAAASVPIPCLRDRSGIGVMSEPFKSMWHVAMEKELAGMRERRAFTVVAEPAPTASAKPTDLRYVFNVKTTDGGKFDRCKVRLVAKGFKQRYGIDYKETPRGAG